MNELLAIVRATVTGSDSSPPMVSQIRAASVLLSSCMFCRAMMRSDHSETNVDSRKHNMTMAKASLVMIPLFIVSAPLR